MPHVSRACCGQVVLEEDGWFIIAVKGSHHFFKHPNKPGKITVPHPRDSFPIKTQKSILTAAGIKG
ncbi:type II toxin-antitoxin system HicA family toxin [Paenibacillus pinihumi]|uniref:type II toxin-antitoxin system HicA family toxin n=1 Tax=Paenibacillus pinihumi TaxID=669462 RepID=UPI0009DC07D4|nr:type II toxin-antitoxin system HicA family toxin [Paenibacillus pinihumi]